MTAFYITEDDEHICEALKCTFFSPHIYLSASYAHIPEMILP